MKMKRQPSARLALSEDFVWRLTKTAVYALALGSEMMELFNLEAVRASRPAHFLEV